MNFKTTKPAKLVHSAGTGNLYEELEQLRLNAGDPTFCFLSPETWLYVLMRYQTAQRFTEGRIGRYRCLHWSTTLVLMDSKLLDDEVVFGNLVP